MYTFYKREFAVTDSFTIYFSYLSFECIFVLKIEITSPKQRHINKPTPRSRDSVTQDRLLLWGSSAVAGNLFFDVYIFTCKLVNFENIVKKEEIAQNEQFLLLPQCFQLLVIGYPFNNRDVLTKYVQSRLLQNCLIKERVNKWYASL